MKALTQNEIEALLKRHSPSELLQQYAAQLDKAGVAFLEQEQRGEARALKQFQDWSREFEASLPPVPTQPWTESPQRQRRLWRLPPKWFWVAAILLLAVLPVEYLRQKRVQGRGLTRDASIPADVAATRAALVNAWLALAESLAQASTAPDNDQDPSAALASFYLGLAWAHDPGLEMDPSREARLQSLLGETRLREASQAFPALDPKREPPDWLNATIAAHHRAIGKDGWQQRRTAEAVNRLTLALADQLSQHAQQASNQRRARLNDQWAAAYLELAKHLQISETEVLIRLIRIKENLGEAAAADALTNQLNNLLEN